MSTSQAVQDNDWRERRRIRAWELRQQGWSQDQIASALGVTQGAVSQWLKKVREGGLEALRRQPAPGRRAALTESQFTQLPMLLARGAQSYGFANDGWTTKRVARMLEVVFGVAYHPGHVSRLLRKYCPQWRDLDTM
ncbi:MAG: transposase [Anaerolineae bacterium]|nr:transposase [Anaerolineae bacterium]